MAVNWSQVLKGQVGGAGPGSAQASSTLAALQQMTPQQQQQYVDSLPDLTSQQKQQLLQQLQQQGTAPAPQPVTGTPLSPASGGLPGAGIGTSPLGPQQPFAPQQTGQPIQSMTPQPDPNALYRVPPLTPTPTPAILGFSPQDAWQYASSALGYDSKAAYQSYVSNYQQSLDAAHIKMGVYRGEGPSASASNPPPPLDQNAWLENTIQTSEGQMSPVVEYYANTYAQETGQTMPASVRQQLLATINAAGPEVRASIRAQAVAMLTPPPPPTAAQQELIASAGTALQAAQTTAAADQSQANLTALATAQTAYQNAVNATTNPGTTANPSAYGQWLGDIQTAQTTLTNYVGTGGFLFTPFSTAVQSAPNMVQQQQQASILKAFQAVGMSPSPAAYAALAKATPDEVQQYIATQPLPDDPKIPYGVYQATKSNVDSLYLQYFGSMPNHDQLMGYMGMNADQIQQHIMASPSKQLPGETVGRFAQLQGFANSMVPAIGYGVSDQVIAAAHTGMQKP